jgi:hypothetical protein
MKVLRKKLGWFNSRASIKNGAVALYAKFNARLNEPRSFIIFSCSSVIA